MEAVQRNIYTRKRKGGEAIYHVQCNFAYFRVATQGTPSLEQVVRPPTSELLVLASKKIGLVTISAYVAVRTV